MRPHDSRHDPGTDRSVTAVVTDHTDSAHVVRWAAHEALVRGHGLRLLAVLDSLRGGSRDRRGLDEESAVVARLLAARAIVDDVTRGVDRDDLRVDMRTGHGPLVRTLIEVSHRTGLIVSGAWGSTRVNRAT